VPALVFCTVFGLSMDYEVFLVARVAEARRAGLSEDEALAEGLARTGPVITSAAAIMIAVFAAFTLGEFVLLKMLGFALAVAVFSTRRSSGWPSDPRCCASPAAGTGGPAGRGARGKPALTPSQCRRSR